MPNTFAYLALYAWPLVMVMLFRKLPLDRAIIWSLLGAFLLLPSAVTVKFPMIPPMDKTTIPNAMAALLCFFALRQILKGHRTTRLTPHARSKEVDFIVHDSLRIPLAFRSKGEKLFLGLLALYLLTPVVTALTNPEPLFYGPVRLPGLGVYDIISIMISLSLTIIPLLIGRYFLAAPESQALFLKALCLGALAYSLPMLFEARMSPQLHRWVYGFFQHDFAQHVRAGGFRPVVFLRHGLLLALFILMALLATIPIWRRNKTEKKSLPWIYAFGWLCLALFIAKSFGPLAMALFFAPVLLLCKVRTQMILAAAIGLVVLFYPMLRSADLLPVDEIYAYVLTFSEDRAQSFLFRLDNEVLLLAHANERPLAGWGTWSRSEVFDPLTGRQLTIPDGTWIITIGVFGWLGYIGYFGVLILPILLLALRARRLELSLETVGMAMILAVNLLDLIPNASVTPLTHLMGGALMGRYALGNLTAGRRVAEDQPAQDQPARGPRQVSPAPLIVRQPRRARH